jgi:aspartyl-tRNA(Asn)/glutamyl-tRNA(Gln) amidotransferase subunit A
LGAFREVLAERAIGEAKRATDELAEGTASGPLHGVPVAIKELFDVAGARGCYGSRVFENRISTSDAEAVRRLREAGAIVVGVTRSHEFGWGITTQHADFGSTVNPWDSTRVPGGSSGGSAAAVAARLVPLALGSDTGGSIRIPAAFCGVFGLKPTYGRIPKRGGVPLAPSLDHPGPLARNPEDLAIGLEAMAGIDSLDPSTINTVGMAPAGPHAKNLMVGISRDLHLTPLADDHAAWFDRVVAVGADLTAGVEELAFPEAVKIRPAFAIIQMAEAYDVHTRQLGVFPGQSATYGVDVRKRLEMASAVGIGDYLSATEERHRAERLFAHVFSKVDILLTPVSAGGPSKVDHPDKVTHMGKPLPFRDLVMNYTVPQDLAGIPACAVPIGLDSDGLPVGVQISGRWGDERKVLAMAAAFSLAFPTPVLRYNI